VLSLLIFWAAALRVALLLQQALRRGGTFRIEASVVAFRLRHRGTGTPIFVQQYRFFVL